MTSADFLLELLSEEIPARMQAGARNSLARMFAEELDGAGLQAEAIETFATPRRLALIARGLPLATAAQSEEIKGPRASAPPQALEGFLRKTGLTRNALVERDGVLFAVIDKPGQATSAVLGPAIERIVRGFPWPKSMRWGAASASMSALRWVRPLHGIVALLGEEIVPVEVDGIAGGATTVGHRFHHPGPITLGGASDYLEKLKACRVIVDQDERAAIIREGARAAAEGAGLALVEDEGLVAENAGLTEWPVPLLGRFDPDYLDVPREVIVLTMRTNQKYFACTDESGALAPAFVCTANIEASDGGAAIVEGNRRVLAARLADARFFWEQDLKVALEEQAKKLSGIVFHEKLGTVADKVERLAKLARWLVEEGIVGTSLPQSGGEGDRSPEASGGGAEPSRQAPPSALRAATSPSPLRDEREVLAQQAERAARLAKADLVTGMVGEFPELQGIVGGYLAERQGEEQPVADAIRDHYKPVGQGDEVPTAPVTVAVALADKLDTLLGFFLIDEPPTGSRDPYALRRAALGAIAIITGNRLRSSFETLMKEAGAPIIATLAQAVTTPVAGQVIDVLDNLGLPRDAILSSEFHNRLVGSGEGARVLRRIEEGIAKLMPFVADRLKVQQREAGVRHDLIDAVFALGEEDDLVRLLARVQALQAFVETGDGANLLAGYKRAANILKKEGWSSDRHPGLDPGSAFSPEEQEGQEGRRMPDQVRHDDLPPEEQALVAALDGAEPRAQAAIEAEDFRAAMSALASLRQPIDAFFDAVTVNDPNPSTRARRLDLLARFRDAVHRVADFSRVEG